MSKMIAAVMRRADRLACVLRYHRPQQLSRRLWNRLSAPVARRIPRRPLAIAPDARPGDPPPNRYSVGHGQAMTADELRQGRIRLLNLQADLGMPLDWHHPHWPDAPLLWDFHLHYHEFLAQIASNSGEENSAVWPLIWSVVEQWMAAFPTPRKRTARTAWHPYCISRRLPVWALLYRIHPPEKNLATRVRRSFAEQARHLTRNLERDIGGNHLWENAKALTTAGCFLSGPLAKRWLYVGLTLLRQCLDEQVSAEGEHFEKSPAYQADLAAGLVDLEHWLRPVIGDQADDIAATAQRMEEFLRRICHPDGTLPLFGDSTAVKIEPLPMQCHQSGWVGDYYVHSGPSRWVVFDAGNIGPDDLPAHSHADLLGFEASVLGQRLFVDSGIYAYTGPRRNEYRRSAAHNVLTVDDRELADVWSSFRVGRRGHVVNRRSEKEPWGAWVWAAHDAYRSVGIPQVKRLWVFIDEGPCLSIHIIAGRSPQEHSLVERLHCHPDVTAQLESESRVRLQLDAGAVFLTLTSPATLAVEPSVYSPDFYIEQPATQLMIRQQTRLPALTAWCLSPGDAVGAQVSLEKGSVHIQWSTGHEQRRIQIPIEEEGQ